ncbi:MAG: class B sortase [Ruminococcus sp.]|nr:class B sortase [Ruminococcus sp.]
MNKKAKIVSAAAAGIAAIGLAVGAVVLDHDDKGVPTVSDIVEVTQAPTEPPTLPRYEYVPSEGGMTERAKMLLKKNKDIYGWIKIENTQVDYPVVRDPGEIPAGVAMYGGEALEYNSFYLDHDLDLNYLREGTLFMDWRDDFGSVEEDQSENIVIYGHNMANNTMFGSLRRYRQDYDFYEEAPFIEMSSNYRDYDYVIFACLITSGNWYTDFVYWDMEELDTDEEFNSYLESVRSKQMFDTGIDVQPGDKLLTLSTCYADEDNSRFLVVARRLRDGEVAGDLSSVQHTEEYIKAYSQDSEESAEN